MRRKDSLKPTSTIEKREFEDTISGCYKALESTLKVICQRKEWSFSKRETAGKLIQTVFKKGLIPSELQSQFHSLKKTLLEGMPSIRNQFSGHGTGTNDWVSTIATGVCQCRHYCGIKGDRRIEYLKAELQIRRK